MSKPLHLSTNPESLVKIAPLVSELRGLESRPLKKKKYRKNIGKIYSPSGKFAERAKSVNATAAEGTNNDSKKVKKEVKEGIRHPPHMFAPMRSADVNLFNLLRGEYRWSVSRSRRATVFRMS